MLVYPLAVPTAVDGLAAAVPFISSAIHPASGLALVLSQTPPLNITGIAL